MTFMHKLSRRLAMLKDRGLRGGGPAAPRAPVAPSEQPLRFADSLQTLALPVARTVASAQTFTPQPNRAHTVTPPGVHRGSSGNRIPTARRALATRGDHAGAVWRSGAARLWLKEAA